MPLSRQTLKKLVYRYRHLCQKAHEKAIQQAWQDFIKIGARQARVMHLLQLFFAKSPPNDTLLTVLLEAKQSLDKATLLAEQHKKYLLAQLEALQTGKKGIALYHDAERAFLEP